MLALAIACAASPALADDAACRQAAQDHTSFKAIISDDDSGKPQYETVERGKNDGMVAISHYTADQKRTVRHTIGGLFSKENDVLVGGSAYHFGMSHSIDITKLLPLKPATSVKFRTIMVREGTLLPQYSEVTLTTGNARQDSLGGCTLQVIDVTVVSRAAVQDVVTTFKAAFVPALDYPLESSVEVVRKADVKTYVTKLREIQPWSPSEADKPAQ
jgi:hypothetical protein